MRLLSVNVSHPKEVEYRGRMIHTGIFKEPVQGRVTVRRLNIDGDGQADLVGHGGEQRAALVYTRENYDFWTQQLGRTDFSFGQFGENLTVEGMLDDEVHVGDRFRIGTTLFEVSQPRVPCYKLAMKMETDGFYNMLLEKGRPGFYFRVLEEGHIEAGNTIERVSRDRLGMSVPQMSNLLYFSKDDLGGARAALAIEALSIGWKHSFEQRIAKAQARKEAEQPRRVKVTRKVPESETITSFYLEPIDETIPETFLPGQFLPFKLDIPGQYQPVYRTYSLSDRPHSGYYRVSIKREPAPPGRPDVYPGVSSNYFHDKVDVGTELQVHSPRGKFFLKPGENRPLVLLSAGVGLTPFISMLNSIVDRASRQPIWFLHGARNGNEHAFGRHVRKLAAEHSNVHAHIRYSQPTSDDTLGRDYDDQGRIDINLIRSVVPDRDGEFYVCGPTPFMKSTFNGLLDWGVAEAQIHYEFFGAASALGNRAGLAQPKRLAELSQCCEETRVTFARSGITANWNPDCQSILDLAEAHGLSPDFSCRSGICHTCTAPLEAGEIEYDPEPLDLPESGSVLICVSKPKSDVTVAI
jgi:ferredoxin-NADP reductase/MOSC domain-containing protein YiiM